MSNPHDNDLMMADIDIRATLAAIATMPPVAPDSPAYGTALAEQLNAMIDIAKRSIGERDAVYAKWNEARKHDQN